MNSFVPEAQAADNLGGVLTLALENGLVLSDTLEILGRRRNEYTSTFHSEIVSCRINGGRPEQVLCKFGRGDTEKALGHRHGVAYEAWVYREVLQPLRVSAPRLFGAYIDSASGITCLAIEYLRDAERLEIAANTRTVIQAARWAASFHALNEARVSSEQMRFLNRYDSAYCTDWLQRTRNAVCGLPKRLAWLEKLCERAERLMEPLLLTMPTIIHGEYYPSNILIREGAVFPVDWESAGVAAGEVDLASLTEGWPAELTRECELEYERTRWPGGSPAEFEQRLDAARLYLHLRWLTDQPEWTDRKEVLWRFEQLQHLGERLQLI